MKFPLLLVLCSFLPCSVFAACTLSIASPVSAEVVSSTSASPYTVVPQLSGCTTLATIQYFINGEPQYPVVRSYPWTFKWNSNYAYNGNGQVIYGVAYDAKGAVLATSPSNIFEVSNINPQPKSAISCTESFPLSPWSGTISVTSTCTGPSAAHSKTFDLLIGGKRVATQSGVTGTSQSLSGDTTQFLNGTYQWYMIVSDNTTGQPSGRPSNLSQVHQGGGSVTITNSSTPVYAIWADAVVVPLDLGSATTHQITLTAVHSDGSTTTPSATYVSSNAAVCTVNSSGLITATGLGTCLVTATTSSGAKQIWANVLADRTKFYQFNRDSSIASNWSTNSLGVYNTMLHSGENAVWTAGAAPDANYSSDQFAKDWLRGGWNVIDQVPIYTSTPVPKVSDSTSTFTAGVAASIAPFKTFHDKWGIKIHLIPDNALKNNNSIYMSSQGPGASATYIGSQTALQYALSQWYAAGIVASMGGPDEVGTTCCPLLGQLKVGFLGFSSLTASAGACVGNITNIQSINTPSKGFIITGSSVTNLNSANGAHFTITSFGVGGNSANFSCPGVANGTYTSGNDSGLTWQFLADLRYDSTGAVSTDGTRGTGYQNYDGFVNIRNQFLTAGTPRLMFAAPPAGFLTPAGAVDGNYSFNALYNWAHWGDYAEIYTINSTNASGATNFIPSSFPLPILTTVIRDTYYSAYALINQAAPFLCEPTGVPTDYGFQGDFFNLTSAAGDTITFASAPNPITTVLDHLTRVVLAGLSTSADNGQYYVFAAPNLSGSTTARLYNSTATVTASATSSSATLHFSDGSNYLANAIVSTAGSPAGNAGITVTITTTVDSTCAVYNKRGQLLTISGGSPNTFPGTYYMPLTQSLPQGSCPAPHNIQIFLTPNFSSTGGTAEVLTDNGYVRNRNIPGPTGNEIGSLYFYAQYGACMAVGANGARTFFMGLDENGFNAAKGAYNATALATNLVFHDTHSSQQLGVHPHWSNAPGNSPGGLSLVGFEAQSANARKHQRWAKLVLQARQASPDYGDEFIASVRAGGQGSILMIQSVSNSTQTRTVDLTVLPGCGGGGQQIIKNYSTWTGESFTTIAAGTSTDNLVAEGGSNTFYACPNSSASEYSPPLVSAQLANVTNAAGVTVRAAYSPWALLNATITGTDCGTGRCVLPLDPYMGDIYFQFIYTDSSGVPLTGNASSDYMIYPKRVQ